MEVSISQLNIQPVEICTGKPLASEWARLASQNIYIFTSAETAYV